MTVARSPARCPVGVSRVPWPRSPTVILRGDPPQLLHFGIADSDAWDVGLPCGGEIDVWVEAYEPGRFEQIARAGGRAAEVTVLEGAAPGAKLLVEADGARSGSLGSPELDDEAARMAGELLWAETSERRDGLFVDVVGPSPRLARVRGGRHRGVAVFCGTGLRMASVRDRSAGAVRHSVAVPRRGRGHRRLARGRRRASGRDRSGHLDRGADARPQARRRRAAAGAALAGAVRRRDGVAACPGQAARAAGRRRVCPTTSSSGYRRRSAWTSARSPARRPRCRSWPRSWPPGTAATVAGWPSARAGSTRCPLDLRV